MNLKQIKEQRAKLIELLRMTKNLDQQRQIKLQIDWLEEQMVDDDDLLINN